MNSKFRASISTQTKEQDFIGKKLCNKFSSIDGKIQLPYTSQGAFKNSLKIDHIFAQQKKLATDGGQQSQVSAMVKDLISVLREVSVDELRDKNS